MKKILAIVLALCLTLSLSVVAFAANNSPELTPPASNAGVGMGGVLGGKYAYSAVDANGNPVTVTIVDASGLAEVGLLSANGVVAAYSATVGVTSGPVTLNVYAPGASASNVVLVLVNGEWEAGLATIEVSGDRAFITIDASVISAYHLFAIVENWDGITVNQPAQGTDNDEDPTEGDEFDVTDNQPEQNPHTGIALAVVPMMVAAAAIVASKRR